MQAMHDDFETATPASSPNQCSDSAFTTALIILDQRKLDESKSAEREKIFASGEAASACIKATALCLISEKSAAGVRFFIDVPSAFLAKRVLEENSNGRT